MNRTKYLREETISGRNKCKRAPIDPSWTVAREDASIPVRKALSFKMLLEEMPIFVGEQELIVGTKTLFVPQPGNEEGKDHFSYRIHGGIPYINDKDVELFGRDESFLNKTHYTPDMGILLRKGISGILEEVEERLEDASLRQGQIDFLHSVKIAYEALANLCLRYAKQALLQAKTCENEKQKQEWEMVANNCESISSHRPINFLQATQLLWLGHLVTNIESFEFINYGRLDVILESYVGQESDEEIRQILECLLLKMYDQVDINDSYLNKYGAQLVVTLGGVLENGENAVGRVSMQFLEAIHNIRLPEPEFNLRIHSKNPRAFVERAAELTISGCNFISYYNDDLFVENLIQSGMKAEWARSYGFDLCQDITIPGIGDLYCSAYPQLAGILLEVLHRKDDYASFEALLEAVKDYLAKVIKDQMEQFNQFHKSVLSYRDGNLEDYFETLHKGEGSVNFGGRSLMCPLPYLSALYEGCLETATDVTLEGYPCKDKGMMIGSATEAINSLAAIRKLVYVDGKYSLAEIVEACKDNYKDKEVMRRELWAAPKWGNDDDFVDLIGKEILEFGLREGLKYQTVSGGRHLVGIHQPHPVAGGEGLGATPEGRFAGAPIAVTLTPESGTMKKGPTAVLKSSTKIDSSLIQWNFCVMINYFTSAFQGNAGKDIFLALLDAYFQEGGLQHQPNVLDVGQLKEAQLHPEQYKDLIVRLWGVSAHFVDLPEKLQKEMIDRFS